MKLSRQEEKRILELLRSQPETGLELVMDRFGPAVKWIARTILGSDARQDVEECIAETFVRLWRNSGGFDCNAGTTLYSYTCGIARHVALDMVRRRPKEELNPEAAVGDVIADFTEQLADQEIRALVYDTVDGLTPPDREIFLLRYWMELSVRRVAELLGLSEKQVENRLHRGKKVLRERLKERGITHDR